MAGVGTNAQMSWRRIGGIAGIVFGLGMGVFFVLSADAPTLNDPIGDIRDYFADATTYFILAWFSALFFVLAFLLFASALRSILAGNDGDAGMWARASFAGAVATVAIGGVATVFWSALALNGADDFSDEIVRALMSLDALAYGTIMPWGLALFLTGASVVILRTGALWRWLGWFGLAIALVMLIGMFWVIDGDPEGPLSVLVWIGISAMLLWSLLTGVAMIRTEKAA